MVVISDLVVYCFLRPLIWHEWRGRRGHRDSETVIFDLYIPNVYVSETN